MSNSATVILCGKCLNSCYIAKGIVLFISDIFPHILTHPTDTSTKSESTEVSSLTVTTSTRVIPNVINDDVGRYYFVVWANRRGTESNNVIMEENSLLPVQLQNLDGFSCFIQ